MNQTLLIVDGDAELCDHYRRHFAAKALEVLRLAECIERALHATGHGALRDVEVVVNARTVRLAGRVPSYYLKQLAQVAVMSISGMHQIENDLNVAPPTCHEHPEQENEKAI